MYLEYWYEDSAWYVAQRMSENETDRVLTSGDCVYLNKKVKRANEFQMISGVGEFCDWDYQKNGGLVIRRSIQVYSVEKGQLNLF